MTPTPSPLTQLLFFLGRVKFTIVLLVGGAVIMAAGTIIESADGREAAWARVYGTAWFDVFLLLIAVNLVLAVVIRIPIQRHQWGFVLTHFAIVLLLVGAWITRTYGYEGRLYVYEGQEENRIYLSDLELTATWEGDEVTGAAFLVPSGRNVTGRVLQAEEGPRPSLRVVQHVPDGVGHQRLGVGDADDPPGLEFTLAGGGAKRDDWVIADDPRHGRLSLRPIQVTAVRGTLGPAGVLAGPSQYTLAIADGGAVQLARTGANGPEVLDVQPGTSLPLGSHGLSLTVTKVHAHARAEMHVQPAPAGSDDGEPFLRLEAALGGATDGGWLAIGDTVRWMLDGRRVEVTFGRESREVPFAVALKEFEVEYYPGSRRPKQYQSDIVLKSDTLPGGELDTVISMNRPLDVAGFRLFQSSYQLGQGGRPDATILSVARDPGAPVVYLSFVLVTIGIAWYIVRRPASTQVVEPPQQSVRPAASAKARSAASVGTLLAAVLLSTPGAVRAADLPAPGVMPVEGTRGWAILAGGRLKPLQTWANEMSLAVTGRESLKGYSSLEILWGYLLAPDAARELPFIRMDSQLLKQSMGLSEDEKRFSFTTLAGNDEFRRVVDRALQKQGAEQDLTRLESDALSVYSKLDRVNELLHGNALAIVPVARADGGWSSPGELRTATAPAEVAVAEGYDALAAAYTSGDAAAFATQVQRLTELLPAAAPQSYPTTAAMERELFHEDFNAYGKAWKLYLLGFLVLLFAGFSERHQWGWWVGTGLLTLGFVCHALGIGLRWSIAQRAPVSDMYESLVFMGGGAILIGLIPEWIWRKRFLGLGAGMIGFLSLVFAENLPIDSAINPLVPVLAHTYWLSVHVMTIMLSYSALAVAAVLGHGVFFLLLFQRDKTERLQTLSHVLYKTLQVGLLFLAAGIACGAIWANESWGRYWGWDPKETWSLITFFVYLVIVHAKFAGWVRDFGIAALAVLGFMSVVMTYYGVNFVLAAGLHSYGAGEGGPGWAMAYAAVECAIVAAAWVKYRAGSARLAASA